MSVQGSRASHARHPFQSRGSSQARFTQGDKDTPHQRQDLDNGRLSTSHASQSSIEQYQNGALTATDVIDSRTGPNPFSAVPFYPGESRVEDRRTSEETLTDIGDSEGNAKKEDFENVFMPSYSFRNGFASDLHRRHSSQVPPQNSSDLKESSNGHSTGFFDHIKYALKHFSDDEGILPEQYTSRISRKDSSASSVCSDRGSNNFERSLAMNTDVEDTYLYDEEQPDERASIQDNRRPGTQERRLSYAERRKREKHYIKYCAEPMEKYQKFVLTIAKALLAFGSPSHRIEAQLNSLTKVFQMEAQFHHNPGSIQVSFGNPESRSSETCLIKSSIGLDLYHITIVHNIYRAVLHDEMRASEGTRELQTLLAAPLRYGLKLRSVMGFISSMLICGIAFGGSLNDMWVAGLTGFVVKVTQSMASKSDLSASGSEVFTAALVSLVARGFSSFYSRIWCFTAISSAGVVAMLPGFLILSGSLDIAGRNTPLGAPKIVSGIMTSLYLGFGLTIGSDVFLFLDRPARAFLEAADALTSQSTVLQGVFYALNSTNPADKFTGVFTFQNATEGAVQHIVHGCYRDPTWGWYLQPLPYWSLFILVPIFALCSSINHQQKLWTPQMIVMVAIACVAFWITRLANIHWGLQNHPDYVSLIGAFLVGVLGNGYARRFGGTAFIYMLTGILLLVPDGLSAAGGLAQNNTDGADEYMQSLDLARKMISVIIGIMAGVYLSAQLIYLFGRKKNAALVTF